MKKHVLMAMLCAGHLLSQSQDLSVYFDKDKYVLKENTKQLLDSLSDEIKKTNNPLEEIGLVGHTDSDASDVYNQNLSHLRSRAVADYLWSKGINNRFHIDWKGEAKPVNKNNGEPEMKWNRRVEVVRNYKTDHSFYNKLDEKFQEFTINPLLDTSFYCANGTQLIVSQNCFENVDPNQPITVRVKEYNELSSFIKGNLTTLTDKSEMLESKGMVYIEVKQNDQLLNLKQNATIGIGFKDRELGDDTKIFDGVKENNEIVWNLSKDNAINHDPLVGKWSADYVLYDSGYKDTLRFNHQRYLKTDTALLQIKTNKSKHYSSCDTLVVDAKMLTKDLVMKTTKMGWINCDKFSRDTIAKIDMMVEYKGDGTPNFIMVFEDYNSILPYSAKEGNWYIFKNVPTGKDVRFIGLNYDVKANRYLFADKRSTISEGKVESMELSPLTYTELEKAMEGLR